MSRHLRRHQQVFDVYVEAMQQYELFRGGV